MTTFLRLHWNAYVYGLQSVVVCRGLGQADFTDVASGYLIGTETCQWNKLETWDVIKWKYFPHNWPFHYIDVIMTTMASQITCLTIVYSTVYTDADQRKHQSSSSLAFLWGIHRWIPRTNGQLRGKCFHLMTLSCCEGISPVTRTTASDGSFDVLFDLRLNKRQQIGSVMVQIMACRLLGTKSLSEPMLRYCQLDTKE